MIDMGRRGWNSTRRRRMEGEIRSPSSLGEVSGLYAFWGGLGAAEERELVL